jgi:hypothetical protein
MDEILAVLQASSTDEAAEQAIKHMECPFQCVERPQVRTIDHIVSKKDQSNHVLISEAEYHHCNGADNASVAWILDDDDQYVPSGMFNRLLSGLPIADHLQLQLMAHAFTPILMTYRP